MANSERKLEDQDMPSALKHMRHLEMDLAVIKRDITEYLVQSGQTKFFTVNWRRVNRAFYEED